MTNVSYKRMQTPTLCVYEGQIDNARVNASEDGWEIENWMEG